MPLTLVVGPANSAKAGEVLGAYSLARERGALLVVPTVRDAEVYARELAADGAVMGGSVLTFGGLAREIAHRVDLEAEVGVSAGAGAGVLSTLQRERLLRLAISRADLGPLARSAEAPGFAAAALELIAELERSLIAPQRFARALERWAAGDTHRQRYAHAIASIYDRYWGQLERVGGLDAELFAWRALDYMRAAPHRWGAAPVFFYGFDDLTPLERDAIETLARTVGAEVTVSLTYEAGRSALAARAEVVEELRAIAGKVIELPALDRYYQEPVLHLLERRLFEEGSENGAGSSSHPGDPDGRPDPGSAVRLLEAGGERAEAELVCAEVLELLKAGFAGEQIAVVYRSLASVAPLLERVFGEFGIPLSLERRVPLAHTSLGRGVLALARCALGGEQQASAADLVAYVRTPGVLCAQAADKLEATIRREGLRTAAEARERCGLRFGELGALRDSAAPARELERQARRLLAAPQRGQAALLDDSRLLDARSLSVLVRSLSELEALGESPSLGELVELLERLEVPASTGGGEGAVLATEPLQIRARRFRAVFVCGLQEGTFPAAAAPEPFLPDEWRRELAAASGLRLRPREDALGRERYLFYSCLSRATERVVLSFRSSDEEGNIELPSPFIADVAELLAPGFFERRRRRLLADVVWDLDEAPSERERERSEAALAELAQGEPAAAEHESAHPARAEHESAHRARAEHESAHRAGSERRLSETALQRVRHREILSAGALEAYASCPVKWLVERELRPERLDPDPDPLARGSFIHDLLEELLRRLGGPVTPSTLPDAERILDELLAQSELPLARGRPQSVRAGALRSVAADVRRYLRYEAQNGPGWNPEAVELRFGFEEQQGSLPALELGPGIRMRGVIDRLDVDGTGQAIVRDYKTGGRRAEFQGARWREDRQLQVALYMRAVRELLGLDPVAGFYQPLGGDDLRARGMFLDGAAVGSGVVATDARGREEFDEVLDDARARALALAARLRSGDLTPCPETCSRDGCMYPGICRTE